MESSWYNRSAGDVFTNEGRSLPGPRGRRRDYVELRCSQCGSAEFKKVSLAYQEGLYRVDTRTRLWGLLLGTDEPSVLVGKAKTVGSHQTELSKHLRPPMKWSYMKVVRWFGLGMVALLIGTANTAMRSSLPVPSVPGEVLFALVVSVLVLVVLIIWRHNHSTYPTEYTKWDRSFICQRCGTVIS